MKCFYHVDADGKAAGFMVYKYESGEETTVNKLRQGLKDLETGGYYPLNIMSKSDFIKINYGMEFPFDQIEKGERVYIVDYSIEPDEMRALLKITSDVIWIDHHKTAIEKYKDFEANIPGIRYDGIAGCMLTWIYLFTDYKKHLGDDLSEYVDSCPYDWLKYIADQDVWKFVYGDKTRYFCDRFNSLDHNEPYDYFFRKLCFDHSLTDELIYEGEIINEYKKNYFARMIKSKAFKLDLPIRPGSEAKYNILALNAAPGFANSAAFDSVINRDQYVAFLIFGIKDDRVNCTLYSDKIDCSEIAKNYGGGGHKGAAGFSMSLEDFYYIIDDKEE